MKKFNQFLMDSELKFDVPIPAGRYQRLYFPMKRIQTLKSYLPIDNALHWKPLANLKKIVLECQGKHGKLTDKRSNEIAQRCPKLRQVVIISGCGRCPRRMDFYNYMNRYFNKFTEISAVMQMHSLVINAAEMPLFDLELMKNLRHWNVNIAGTKEIVKLLAPRNNIETFNIFLTYFDSYFDFKYLNKLAEFPKLRNLGLRLPFDEEDCGIVKNALDNIKFPHTLDTLEITLLGINYVKMLGASKAFIEENNWKCIEFDAPCPFESLKREFDKVKSLISLKLHLGYRKYYRTFYQKPILSLLEKLENLNQLRIEVSDSLSSTNPGPIQPMPQYFDLGYFLRHISHMKKLNSFGINTNFIPLINFQALEDSLLPAQLNICEIQNEAVDNIYYPINSNFLLKRMKSGNVEKLCLKFEEGATIQEISKKFSLLSTFKKLRSLSMVVSGTELNDETYYEISAMLQLSCLRDIVIIFHHLDVPIDWMLKWRNILNWKKGLQNCKISCPSFSIRMTIVSPIEVALVREEIRGGYVVPGNRIEDFDLDYKEY